MRVPDTWPAPSYVADTIRAHFPVLGIGAETSIVPMQRQR